METEELSLLGSEDLETTAPAESQAKQNVAENADDSPVRIGRDISMEDDDLDYGEADEGVSEDEGQIEEEKSEEGELNDDKDSDKEDGELEDGELEDSDEEGALPDKKLPKRNVDRSRSGSPVYVNFNRRPPVEKVFQSRLSRPAYGAPKGFESRHAPSNKANAESSWEKGLREAREAMKRASAKRQEDPDFEEKRLLAAPSGEREHGRREVDSSDDARGSLGSRSQSPFEDPRRAAIPSLLSLRTSPPPPLRRGQQNRSEKFDSKGAGGDLGPQCIYPHGRPVRRDQPQRDRGRDGRDRNMPPMRRSSPQRGARDRTNTPPAREFKNKGRNYSPMQDACPISSDSDSSSSHKSSNKKSKKTPEKEPISSSDSEPKTKKPRSPNDVSDPWARKKRDSGGKKNRSPSSDSSFSPSPRRRRQTSFSKAPTRNSTGRRSPMSPSRGDFSNYTIPKRGQKGFERRPERPMERRMEKPTDSRKGRLNNGETVPLFLRQQDKSGDDRKGRDRGNYKERERGSNNEKSAAFSAFGRKKDDFLKEKRKRDGSSDSDKAKSDAMDAISDSDNDTRARKKNDARPKSRRSLSQSLSPRGKRGSRHTKSPLPEASSVSNSSRSASGSSSSESGSESDSSGGNSPPAKYRLDSGGSDSKSRSKRGGSRESSLEKKAEAISSSSGGESDDEKRVKKRASPVLTKGRKRAGSPEHNEPAKRKSEASSRHSTKTSSLGAAPLPPAPPTFDDDDEEEDRIKRKEEIKRKENQIRRRDLMAQLRDVEARLEEQKRVEAQ